MLRVMVITAGEVTIFYGGSDIRVLVEIERFVEQDIGLAALLCPELLEMIQTARKNALFHSRSHVGVLREIEAFVEDDARFRIDPLQGFRQQHAIVETQDLDVRNECVPIPMPETIRVPSVSLVMVTSSNATLK